MKNCVRASCAGLAMILILLVTVHVSQAEEAQPAVDTLAPATEQVQPAAEATPAAEPATATEETESSSSFDPEKIRKPFEKLGRGVINVSLSPMEIVNTVIRETSYYLDSTKNPDNSVEFVLTTPFIAVGYTVVRLGVGLVDIVTFPAPLGKFGYDELYSPEYVPPFYSKENLAYQ